MKSQSPGLCGKSVLITGAGSGLGRQLALDFAAQNCRLALADRNPDGLAETLRLSGTLTPAFGRPTDVTDPADCAELLRAVTQEYGGLDVLVLCAGVSMWARFDEVRDPAVFRRLMEVNYLGAVHMLLPSLPLLRASHGVVVAISSLQGEIALPYHSGYAASKHALNGLLDGLEFELGDEIRMLRVLPGWIRGTNLRQNAFTTQERIQNAPRKHSRESVSVEECARLIMTALQKRKREIFIPGKLRALRWIKVVSPALVRWIIGRAVKTQRSVE